MKRDREVAIFQLILEVLAGIGLASLIVVFAVAVLVWLAAVLPDEEDLL